MSNQNPASVPTSTTEPPSNQSDAVTRFLERHIRECLPSRGLPLVSIVSMTLKADAEPISIEVRYQKFGPNPGEPQNIDIPLAEVMQRFVQVRLDKSTGYEVEIVSPVELIVRHPTEQKAPKHVKRSGEGEAVTITCSCEHYQVQEQLFGGVTVLLGMGFPLCKHLIPAADHWGLSLKALELRVPGTAE